MLLDSHVVLWSINDDAKLGARCRALIVGAPHRYVSAVTHVELTVKALRGKLGVPEDLPTLLASMGFTPLALEDRHVAGMRSFENLTGHDPFDRMLLAQALVDGIDFLTADRTLLALDLPWIIDATR